MFICYVDVDTMRVHKTRDIKSTRKTVQCITHIKKRISTVGKAKQFHKRAQHRYDQSKILEYCKGFSFLFNFICTLRFLQCVLFPFVHSSVIWTLSQAMNSIKNNVHCKENKQKTEMMRVRKTAT